MVLHVWTPQKDTSGPVCSQGRSALAEESFYSISFPPKMFPATASGLMDIISSRKKRKDNNISIIHRGLVKCKEILDILAMSSPYGTKHPPIRHLDDFLKIYILNTYLLMCILKPELNENTHFQYL